MEGKEIILMESIEAKQLMQKVKYDTSLWFGNDYTVNLYKGCCHGCIYCDSRSSCYRIEEFDKVRVKENTQELLRNELKSKRIKGVVGLGAMSDTYNPFEQELQVTRKALMLLEEFGFGVSIDTKSPLIVRDKDIIKQIAQKHSAIVKITITTADDTLSKVIEPNVAVSSKRFEAIKELSDAEIFCGVLLTPMLPFITDTQENIKQIVKAAYESGARFVYCMYGVTLRENQRDYFYQQLNQKFEGLTQKYKDTYGNNYVCNSLQKKELEQLLRAECKKYGLLFQMKEIIAGYSKKKEFEQICLFPSD